jgi:hypothetical protein
MDRDSSASEWSCLAQSSIHLSVVDLNDGEKKSKMLVANFGEFSNFSQCSSVIAFITVVTIG